MVRSMYSAVSGLTTNQTRMDVIGNNIANANTVAYKTNTTSQQTAFEQIAISATTSRPVGLSVGLGTLITGTVRRFTQGAFQRTDVPSDLGLQGDGWMQVATGIDSTTTGSSNYLTRAGNLVKDASGYLRTPEGLYLLGYAPATSLTTLPGNAVTWDATATNTLATGLTTANRLNVATTAGIQWTALTGSGDSTGFQTTRIRIPEFIKTGALQTAAVGPPVVTAIPATDERVSNFSVGSDGVVSVVGANGTVAEVGMVVISRFQNNNGLKSEGANLYTYNGAASPTHSCWAGGYGGAASIQAGVLEVSNVDMAREFSDMIIVQRGFDANARTISASDEMIQTVINIKR